MKRQRLHTILSAVLLAAMILTTLPLSPLQAAPSTDPPQAAPAQETEDPPVLLNEVMPKPAAEGAAWVELYVGATPDVTMNLYLPTIAGIPAESAASTAQAASTAAIDLSGWQISNEDGQIYTLPAEVPALNEGIYVLVYFDGQGAAANDYDPADGRITLHTQPGLGDVFPDAQGQAALYRPGDRNADTIVDFVAWGGLDETKAANALTVGIWGRGAAVSFENGFGDISQEDVLERDESAGRYPGAGISGVNAWANYPPGSATPGTFNDLPPVTFITPENGAAVDNSTLSLSWRAAQGAQSYRFQLDAATDFVTPLIDTSTPDTYFKPDPALAAGNYFWRINPIRNGIPAGWTPPFAITAVSVGQMQAAEAGEKVLGIERVRQNKDSRLLGLDGAPEGDPTTDTPENAWDAAAPCTEPPCADNTKFTHGSSYCVRASIRMMASWYNGNQQLSMDRISYYVLQEWTGNTNPGTNDATPDNDLGYARGMYYPDEEDRGISWALNANITTPGGKPTFQQIRDAIDADRPIMFRNPGHMMIMDGYRETAGGDQFIHVLDPDQPPDFERWQDYDTQTIDGYWIGPASGTGRVDEASMWTDSDGDGIMNFDESRRFNLDPYDDDTDGDWVNDKKDMREYVFDSTGNYSKRSSDFDGDGVRKELDFDNDGDGSPDGCEDTNYNGIYQAASGETNNFSAASSQACVPLFNILYPLKTVPVNAGDPAAPDKILVQVSTAVPNGWSQTFTAADFSVTIGGSTAAVLSVYPSADTYFLVVSPPTGLAAAFHNIEVSLSGTGSDAEENAVYFLAKPNNDEVIVMDRSGSMLSNDKIGAAKNAASAFVDFLNDGDSIGVTSFAGSATTDYALTTITGAAERTAAIAAINGFVASGSTALGQGVQQGYGELTSAGNTDHDWSLVLLSDGWENVAPYWVDVQATVTDAVVHTVALGDDADKTLLQSIAGSKHGNYFFVDVDPPGAATASAASISVAPPQIAGTLPNRLADTYIAIGELTHKYQRLFDYIADASEQRVFGLEVYVGSGLPEAIFSLNWDDPAGYLNMTLVDPDGNQFKPEVEYRGDTHYQVRVPQPLRGIWAVQINVLKPTSELQFMLSGKTVTTLIGAVGGDPEERAVGVPVPIYGVLTDQKPIPGADVYALISGPGVPVAPKSIDANRSLLLQLFDDGNHGDGKADDGLYANLLNGVTEPGGYTVKLLAAGKNNEGEEFLRYASTGFNVRPRAAYLWHEDLETALDYEQLLQANNWVVDPINLADVPKTNFGPYC
ncbi:MAG: VWA domain-containing protein [Caldilineaceae bacterium]